MSESVDLWGMLSALRARIRVESYNDFQRDRAFAQITMMQDKATAYMWGREDESGSKIKSAFGRELIDASWEFGHMIGIMVAMSYLESGQRWSSVPCIRDVFAAFMAGTDLRDYVNSPWPQ
jgi:hypothetical protein